MRLVFFSIIIFFIIFTGCKDKQCVYFNDGSKDTCCIEENDSLIICTSHYITSEIKSVHNNVNGEIQGEYLKYFKDGTISEKLNYSESKKHGKAETYYSDGSLKEVSFFKDDKLDGLVTLFHKNGLKKYEWTYKNGIQDGMTTSYNAEGNPTIEYLFQNGKNVSFKYITKNGKEFIGESLSYANQKNKIKTPTHSE